MHDRLSARDLAFLTQETASAPHQLASIEILDPGESGFDYDTLVTLVADRLSALMLTVSSAVTLCVLLYSLAQGEADGDEAAPVSIYHPTYLVLVAGVANAFLSGDLFNLYVGFEILLAASYVLLTLGGTGERIRAGSIYVVVALLSSVLFLVAIALVYASTGTVNLAQLAVRLPQIDPDVRLLLQVMLLLAFGSVLGAVVFFVLLSMWLAAFNTNAGTVDIVLRWGAPVRVTEPGLNFKFPFAETRHTIELRERAHFADETGRGQA